MKRTIEIEDNLQNYCDTAISELKDCIKEFIKENSDIDSLCLSNDINYDGRFHAIIDSNVPIYTSEIDAQWYLHKYELVEAFENAGFDGDSTQNNGMTAIYLYIEQECWEWWYSIEDELNTALLEFQESEDKNIEIFIDNLDFLKEEQTE